MGSIYKGYITETLRKEFEVEAFNEVEALALIEKAYNKNEISLDYDNLVDVEFSNCEFNKKEIQILKIIDNIFRENIKDKKCDNIISKIKQIKSIIENGCMK